MRISKEGKLASTYQNIDNGLLWMFLFSFSPWVHFGTRPLLAYRGLLFMAHMNQHLRFARFHPQLLRLIILARSFASCPNQCLFRPLTVHHHQLLFTQADNDFLTPSSHVPLEQVPNLSNWAIPNSITLRAIFVIYKPFIYPSRTYT